MSNVTAVPIRPLAKGSIVKLWIALIVLVLAAGAIAWWGTAPLQVTTTQSGLRFRVIHEGTGEPATDQDVVLLRYQLHVTGPSNPVIQDSDESGQPVPLSAGSVVPGMAEAIRMMRAGGTYEFWMPPHLGYAGRLPPGAPFGPMDTLYFKVRVVQIGRGMAALQQMMGRPQGGPPGGEAQENMRELESGHGNPHAGAPEAATPPTGTGNSQN